MESDTKQKQKLRRWAKAFDDVNVNLRLQDHTTVYHLGPSDRVLVVSVH